MKKSLWCVCTWLLFFVGIHGSESKRGEPLVFTLRWMPVCWVGQCKPSENERPRPQPTQTFQGVGSKCDTLVIQLGLKFKNQDSVCSTWTQSGQTEISSHRLWVLLCHQFSVMVADGNFRVEKRDGKQKTNPQVISSVRDLPVSVVTSHGTEQHVLLCFRPDRFSW